MDAKLKSYTDKLAAFDAANKMEIYYLEKNVMSENIIIEYQELTKQKQQAQADLEEAQTAAYRATASADNAKKRDAKIVHNAKMNFIYKNENIAMNARRGQASTTKELQAVNDAQKAADDAQKLAAANIAEREKAINELKDKVAEKEKVVSDIIGKMDSLEAKDIALRSARLKELAKAREPLEKEWKQASDKIEKEMFEDYKKNVLWPVGKAVQFDFIVYSDGKTFEIVDFIDEFWLKSYWNFEAVLSVIFAK